MTERSRRFTDFEESNTWATSGSRTTATAPFPNREAKRFGRLLRKSNWYSARSSSRPFLELGFGALLIFLSLAFRRFPRADDPDLRRSLCKGYQQQSLPLRIPDDDLPGLVARMMGVVEDARRRVGEYAQGLVEAQAMLLEVLLSLARIPFELETHRTTSALKSPALSADSPLLRRASVSRSPAGAPRQVPRPSGAAQC